MKAVRTVAALIVLVGAVAAAYYSYSVAFAPPPMHGGAAGGPPAGIKMPAMRGSPTTTKDSGKAVDQVKQDQKKGGDTKKE